MPVWPARLPRSRKRDIGAQVSTGTRLTDSRGISMDPMVRQRLYGPQGAKTARLFRNSGRTLSSARPSGPSNVQPAAFPCPPPPILSAISATFTLPLLRMLSRMRRSGNSRRNTATSTPEMPTATFTRPSQSSSAAQVRTDVLMRDPQPSQASLSLQIRQRRSRSSIL